LAAQREEISAPYQAFFHLKLISKVLDVFGWHGTEPPLRRRALQKYNEKKQILFESAQRSSLFASLYFEAHRAPGIAGQVVGPTGD